MKDDMREAAKAVQEAFDERDKRTEQATLRAVRDAITDLSMRDAGVEVGAPIMCSILNTGDVLDLFAKGGRFEVEDDS